MKYLFFIFYRFNSTNKKLQSVNIDLEIVVHLYTSLYDFIHSLRDNFSHFEKLGIELTGENTYNYDLKRKKKRKVCSYTVIKITDY